MTSITVNGPVAPHEVPALRAAVGWSHRDEDYPVLLERCQLWCTARNAGILVGFGYITGMGLEHGYLEDVMVHPDYQGDGIGRALVQTLLKGALDAGIEIVTTTFQELHLSFYRSCGFTPCHGGVWRRE